MRLVVVLVATVGLLAVGCARPTSSEAPASATAPVGSAASTAGAVPVAAPTAIAKVVFVDKEKACECTAKRIDDSWSALKAALGEPARLPVQRLHADTEPMLTEAYTSAKPLMVAPGLYFVDANDAVVTLLQGEVTTEQITAALGAVPAPTPAN